MTRTIVIYKSISGFTKKYAEMIGDELKSKVLPLDKVDRGTLQDFDIIIYGGSLHAVGIIGIEKMKRILEGMADKRLIVFATGASPNKPDIVKEIKKNNFAEDENAELFYLRGGFNFKKLNLFNKIIMFVFINMIKLKSKKSPDDVGMISAYKKPVDFTNKKNITYLIQAVRKK